jgi:hypothetical protein
MKTVAQYLAQAREFEAMAESTPNDTLKMGYLDLAQAYRKLARERGKLLGMKH